MAIFAALLVSLSASAGLDYSDRAAWREACQLSRYTCRDIPPPMVRRSVFVDKTGAYGLYYGGRTVWLATYLSPVEEYVVTVHEMVHYLQTYEDGGQYPAPNFVMCLREEEAYEISDKVISRIGSVGRLGPRLEALRAGCA